MKHNKKRNTAFLYECLIKEMTKAVVRGELQKKQQIVETLKRYFSKGKPLYNDLQLYKQLMEPQKLEESLGLDFPPRNCCKFTFYIMKNDFYISNLNSNFDDVLFELIKNNLKIEEAKFMNFFEFVL